MAGHVPGPSRSGGRLGKGIRAEREAQEEFWAPDTRNTALLHLRDFVSTAASDLADVATAAGDVKSLLATWPAWK